MADLSDVLTAMAGEIASGVMAGGYLFGAYGLASTGVTTQLYVGWPTKADLDADLAAGRCHISVFADVSLAHNATRRISQAAVQVSNNSVLLTAQTTGNAVTFGGFYAPGTVAGLLVQDGSGTLTSEAYGYRMQATDGPNDVANAFVSLIPNASAVGPVLTIGGVDNVTAIVAADQTCLREVRRQSQVVDVSIWAPDPATRDTLAAAVDLALADIQFVITPGGDAIYVRYVGMRQLDNPSMDRVWRRELRFACEYPTSVVVSAPVMLFGGVTKDGARFGADLLGAPDGLVTEDGVTITDDSGRAMGSRSAEPTTQLGTEDGLTQTDGSGNPLVTS